MGLIFYDFKMAPSPRRARIILAEKNVPHEAVQIDMMKNEQMGAEFRAINPNCTLPALKLEDGTVLTDNAGIAVYLEETFPDPLLMGKTVIEKAKIATWQAQIEAGLGMGVAHALRNANPAMKDRALPGPHDYAQIPELAARGLEQIDHFIKTLETHLEGREFIVTESLSVADITAGVMLDFARIVGKKPSDAQPNIIRWLNELKARPSFNL